MQSRKSPLSTCPYSSNFQMAQVSALPLPLVRPTTWHFDLILQLPAFPSAEDICHLFLAILKDVQVNKAITGLQGFSYQ